MKAYRIARREFASLDGTGAALFPQRWNRSGQRMIYAAETLAVARLELLAHLDQAVPPRAHIYWEITIPETVSVEVLNFKLYPHWHYENMKTSQRVGGDWCQSLRSCVLIVPSKGAVPERNVLLNPAHPDLTLISSKMMGTLEWDDRLFKKSKT